MGYIVSIQTKEQDLHSDFGGGLTAHSGGWRVKNKDWLYRKIPHPYYCTITSVMPQNTASLRVNLSFIYQ